MTRGQRDMEPAVSDILAEFHSRAEKEDALWESLSKEERDQRLDELLLPVGPVVGQLLHSMIEGLNAKSIVEVGSSYGYSTVWLADAARRTGGRVVSLEKHEEKQSHAREVIERAGLADQVDFRLGDAIEIIPQLPAPVHFALIDLWKSLYVPAFDGLYPKLVPNAVVVADNMIYPAPDQAKKYMDHLARIDDLESVMLPVGDGILVTRRLP